MFIHKINCFNNLFVLFLILIAENRISHHPQYFVRLCFFFKHNEQYKNVAYKYFLKHKEQNRALSDPY